MKFCVSLQPHVFLLRSLAHQCLTNMLTLWSLQETLWENMWELTNSHSLSLSRSLLLAQTRHGMWPPSSYAAASFFPACLRLAAACGSFPGQAGISGNVCCFRGAKSRLRSLSHSQTSTQTRKGWPTTTSTHSHKPLSHQAEPLTHPKVQIYLFTVFLTCSSFKQLLRILVKTH